MTDSGGQTATASAAFSVVFVGPVISNVFIAEAKLQDGIVSSKEQGLLNWAVTDSNPLKSASSGHRQHGDHGYLRPLFQQRQQLLLGAVRPLVAGSHTYTIRMTDSAKVVGAYSGSFTIVPATSVGGNHNHLLALPDAAQMATMMAESNRQLAAAQGDLDVDGLRHPAGAGSRPVAHTFSSSGSLSAANPAIPVQHLDLPTAMAQGLNELIGDAHSASPAGAYDRPDWRAPVFGQQPLLPMPGRDSTAAADQLMDSRAADQAFASGSDDVFEAILAAA